LFLVPLTTLKALSVHEKTEWITSFLTYHHEVQIINDLMDRFDRLFEQNLRYDQYEMFAKIFAKEYFNLMKTSNTKKIVNVL
jgi:hypothetical protein